MAFHMSHALVLLLSQILSLPLPPGSHGTHTYVPPHPFFPQCDKLPDTSTAFQSWSLFCWHKSIHSQRLTYSLPNSYLQVQISVMFHELHSNDHSASDTTLCGFFPHSNLFPTNLNTSGISHRSGQCNWELMQAPQGKGSFHKTHPLQTPVLSPRTLVLLTNKL